MGFSLKKLLEGATRQVNIFDNGKTWKNPQGNQSRPSPAQTPPPQSGNMNFAGSKTYGTFNRPSPVVNAAQKQIAQTPKIDTKTKYAQVNAPSYGSGLSGLLNRARDVVDANTAQDRFKRTQIGQPEVVKPMQQQISERAKPIAQGFVEQYNQLGTGVGTLLAQNSKDVKNAQKAQQDLANQLHQQRMATIKLAKAPGVTQPQLNRLNNFYNDLNQKDVELQQQRTNQSNDLYSKLDPKKNLAALASVGFDIATLGYGTAGYQGVKQAGKQGFKAGAKELAKQAGITGSMGAVSGGLSPVVQKGDQATAGDIAKGAATGFAFGAALPVATYGVGSGISKVKDPIQNALKNTGKALGDINPLPKNQIGAIGRNVNDSVDPLEALKAEAKKYNKWTDFVNNNVGDNKSILNPRRQELKALWDEANSEVMVRENAIREAKRIARRANERPAEPERWVAQKPIKMPTEVYRGVGKDGGTGMSMYGSGLYTAAGRKEAVKYGKVSKLGAENLPKNPLQFKTDLDFKQWQYEMAKKLGVDRKDLYGVDEGVEKLVKPLGYDGITVGQGRDMIAVKYGDDIGNQATKPKSNIINRALGLKDSSQGGFVDPEAIKNSFKGKAPKTEGVPKLTEEQYLSQNGAHFMDGAEPALHRQPNKAVNAQKRDVKRTLSAMDENNAKRAELRKEYQAKLEKGEIAEPTRNEILIEKANGLPELESTQAAQRLLTKQGIDWKTPVKTEGVAPKSAPDNLDTLKTNLDKTRQELAPIDKRLTAEFTNKSKNMTEEQKSVLFKEYQAKYEKETASIKKQQADIESSINNYKKSELPDNTTASEVGRLIKESHSKNTFDPKNTGYFINLSKDNIKNITPLKGIDDYGDTMFVDTDAGISTVSIQDWSESGQGFRVSNGNGNEIARFNTDAEARDFARKALTVENEAARQGKRVILSGSRVENRTKSTPVSAPIEKTVEQTPFGPVSKVKKSGTPDQSPELEMQKTPQTQPNLSQATGKVDDLATGTEVSRAGKSGATAQNQTNLEPGNTYTSNKQQRGFKSNIAKDTETPLSVYKDIPGYNVKPNAKTIGSAAQRVAKDPEGTYNRLLENGIQKTDDSADALVLLRNLVENDELDKAGKLAKATAKAGTDFGQAVQIFSAFRKTTPDGALRDAWNIVNAYNAKNPKKTPIRITPEQTKKITDLANDLQNTEYGTREWAKKAALLEREKGLLTPNSFLSKVSTVQTMAQLLNPKTAIRNILGNGVLDLAEDISRLPAAGIDKALKGLGLIDERNMVLPNMKTNWANKLLGFKQGVEDVNLGIRTTGAAGNYDLTKEVFKPGSAGNKLEKLLGYELSSMDKAFFTGRYQSSLENMMKAQNVKVPTPEMKATAEAEALYATFQNNSNLSKALQKGKNAANFGKEWGLGDFILKYPKTPGNIVNVGLDYSPVGFVKGLKSLNDGIKLKNIQNIRNGELLLGRSLVGSGLIAGGAFLAKQGIISGKQDGDFDKSAADRDLGKGPFSFNITALGRLLKGEDTKARPGDITANYDWLQPNAIQLSMGANMVINNNSATQQINTNLESLGAGIDTISEQPVFRGVKDFVGDLNSQQGGGVGKAAQGVATNAFSSFVPSIVNQVGQQFDNTKRSPYSDTPVGEAINKTKGRIPGARNTLYPSLNTLGEEQKQYDVGGNNPFNVFFNPAFLNRVKDSPALSMADELNQKTGETSQYPRSLTGKQTIDGTKTKLTPEQLFNLKKDVGQTTNSIFQQYANSPIYQNLSDTEKVNTLTNALTDINAAGKATLAAKNSLGQYAPGFTGKPTKLSSSQKALISGEYNVDTKMAGTSIPKGLNQDAVKIIASYNKDNAKGLANNQAVTSALTSWNGGRQIPQVTNEVAKQWADYEKGLKDGSLTKLEAKDQKIKILRNAFNSQLNDDEKQLYKLSKTKITSALSEGLITEDNLKKALAVERQMFDNGLLESETLAKKLGLGSRSKSSGSSSRKSSGRKTSRVKSTKLKATKTPISFTKVKNRQKSVNSSLRKLLGSAKV